MKKAEMIVSFNFMESAIETAKARCEKVSDCIYDVMVDGCKKMLDYVPEDAEVRIGFTFGESLIEACKANGENVPVYVYEKMFELGRQMIEFLND